MRHSLYTKSFLPFGLWLALVTLLFACGPKANEDEKSSGQELRDDPNEQIAYLSEKIEEEPQMPSLYLKRGKILMQENRLEQSAADFQKALSIDSTSKWAWYRFAQCLRKQGKATESLEAALRAEQNGLKEHELLTLIGELFFIARDYDRALLYLNNSLRMDPYEPDAYFYKGMLFLEKGDTAKAISSFQTVVEQDMTFVDAYNNLASIYMGIGDWKAAEEYLITGMEQSQDAMLRYNFGLVLEQQALMDSAAGYFLEAYKKRPSLDLAAFNYAVVRYNQNRFEEALPYFEKVENNPELKHDARFFKAIALDMLDRNREAKSLLEQIANSAESPYAEDALYRLRRYYGYGKKTTETRTEADTVN